MDIQQEGNQRNARSSSLNARKVSIASRKSNQSCFSINGTHYYEHPNNQPQKISLDSNISSKARETYNQYDLFDKLAYTYDHANTEMRDQGSFKSQKGPLKHYHEYQKKNIFENVNEKMSEEPPQKQIVKTQEKAICKCPKSKCLLMYCECFSRGIVCNEECSCYQCRNNATFQEKRQNAVKIVLERDPNAFMNKLEIVGGEQSELAYKRGCKCKKTKCFKKYCECYFAGVKCTYLCNCDDCMNGGENAYKS